MFYSFIISATSHQSAKSLALTSWIIYFLKKGITFLTMSRNLVTLNSIQFIFLMRYPHSKYLRRPRINCRVRLSGLLQLASLWIVRYNFPSYGFPHSLRLILWRRRHASLSDCPKSRTRFNWWLQTPFFPHLPALLADMSWSGLCPILSSYSLTLVLPVSTPILT